MYKGAQNTKNKFFFFNLKELSIIKILVWTTHIIQWVMRNWKKKLDVIGLA